MRQARQDWRNHEYARAISGFVKREWPVLMFMVQFLVVGAVVLWVGSVASTTRDSLCTFQQSLEERVATTESFIADNPEGIPGIPVETLQQSVDNQKKTIAALSDGGLVCD